MMFILSFSISFNCLAVILFVSCVIRLWDSAAAHSPSCKELNPSSFNQSCFSGLIVVWCSHIILTGLSLFWCSPILIIKPYMHLCYFILSVVYFYSERPPLSKYFILCVVYFYSERPPLLQRSEAQVLDLRSLYCNDTWNCRYYSFKYCQF